MLSFYLIQWEAQDDVKIEDEYEAEEGMEEEAVIIDENEELEDDVEQMQGIDAVSLEHAPAINFLDLFILTIQFFILCTFKIFSQMHCNINIIS